MSFFDRQQTIDWRASAIAGLVAGFVFLTLEMIMVPVLGGGSPWGPPHMIAAIVLGKGILASLGTFDIGVMVTALAVHAVLSIGFGLVLSIIISLLRTGVSIVAGAAFGLVLYIINFYVFTAIFPWFANARNPVTIFTHIVFGLVAAWAYEELAQQATQQSMRSV